MRRWCSSTASPGGDYPWPDSLVWNGLSAKLDEFQSWLLDQRNATPQSPFFAVFDGFATFVDNLVAWFTDAILWLTWLGAAAVGTIVVLRFGGIRAAAIVAGAFASFALLGLWEASMQTLALMLAAVGLSLLIGIPLGIVAGRSDRFQRAINPVLDAMQIVPAFAYLMPVVILFSTGPAAAVVSTMVYAIPPAIRITALGIRGVATNTVEAAVSMGSTRRQMLAKVQLPLARRMLLLGVNQTILFALSMVVIAGLIGGGGLGAVVTSGLYSNPALAILGGIAIVIMAMALDRATEAIAGRTDPSKRHLDDTSRSRLRLFTLACMAAGAATVAISKLVGVSSVYPETTPGGKTATLQAWLLEQIQWVLDYVQNPDSWVFSITEPIGNFLLTETLLPLQNFLIGTPWFVTLGGLTLIAFLISGLRPAITTFLMLAAIGVLGVWALSMDTLSQVLVATVLAVVFGVTFGVLAAESRPVSKVAASGQRRPADAAAARLHHPVHLSDAGFHRPRDYRRCSLRLPRRRPSRRARRARRCARRGRGRGRVRRHPEADPDEGQGSARRRRDHARGQPGHRDGARGRRDRWPGRIRRPRLRGRAGPRPRPVRAGRDRVARDPGARDHTRPGHPGNEACGGGTAWNDRSIAKQKRTTRRVE